MTPPSPYRERVVIRATLQTAVSFVTVTTLWLAARGSVGWPPPHCQEGFRHGSASGPRACFPSHRPTPGRVPHLELSTYALLGAPFPTYWFTASAVLLQQTMLCQSVSSSASLRYRSVASRSLVTAVPPGVCRVGRRRVTPCYRSTFPSASLRTGRAAFTASGSPVVISAVADSKCRRGHSDGRGDRPRGSCAAGPP